MPDTPAAQPNPLAKHRDPSLRRDRSLRRGGTRASRTTAAGIEWVSATELAMRGAGTVIGLGAQANRRVVGALRRKTAATGRAVSERARRLAPVARFGTSRRSPSSRGVGI